MKRICVYENIKAQKDIIMDHQLNIPLPNELPPPLTRESLNKENVSQAIDMAVIQNTDLMNRLSLALKRTAHLESRLKFSERNNNQRKEKLTVLDDEIHVLRSSQNQMQTQMQGLFTKLNQSEKKYTDIYQQYLEKEQQLQAYQKQIEHFRDVAQNSHVQSQKDLISLVDYHEKRYATVERECKNLKKQLEFQTQKIKHLESEKLEAKKQIAQAQHQITSFEKKLQVFQKESDQNLKQMYNSLERDQKQIQNKDIQIVQLEAKVTHFKKLQEEYKNIQEVRDQLKISLQSKDIELKNMKERLTQSKKSQTTIAANNKVLSDQVKELKQLLEIKGQGQGDEKKQSIQKQLKIIEKLLAR